MSYNKAKRNVAVFEVNSGFRNFILSIYYLLRGFEVIFLYSEKSFKEKRWFSILLRRNLVKKLKCDFNLSITNYYYPDIAFDNMDAFYGAIPQIELINRMTELYGDKHVELAFKKDVHKYLSRFYFINRMMYEAETVYPDSRILYIPSDGVHYRRTDSNEPFTYGKYIKILRKSGGFYYKTERSSFPRLLVAASCARYFLNRAGICLKSAVVCAWLLGISIFSKQRRDAENKKSYRYGIMIIAPARQFGSNAKRVDWILDQTRITKLETLFIANMKLSKANRFHMQRNGLNYVDDVFGYLTMQDVIRSIGYIAYLLRRVWVELNPISATYLNLCVIFAKWKSFCRYFCIDNLISHADFGVQSIGRNIILKKSNPSARTWHYMDSGNFQCYFSNENAYEYRAPAYGFGYYDCLVAWSKKTASYLVGHHQVIGAVKIVGCLWAEQIDYAVKRAFVKTLDSDLKQHGYAPTHKLIGVFDSTFLNWLVTDCSDGIAFAKDILRLLENIEDVYVVFKPKYNLSFTKKICLPLWELYQKIAGHRRAHMVSHTVSPSEAIALCDLTISYPFTSTTFEALSAGRKAIYYDPNSLFKGTYFDNIPHLFCHGYDELQKVAKRLLFEVDERSFRKDIKRFAEDYLDPYMDGKAITRFRDLLVSKEPKSASNPAPSDSAYESTEVRRVL